MDSIGTPRCLCADIFRHVREEAEFLDTTWS